LALPLYLIWAVVGLLLTIGGTLLEVAIASPTSLWGSGSLQVYGLGVTYQVGAVLLTACLGGRTAGALAQVAYVALGLLGVMGQSIFGQGGGLGYIQQPTFGYLLGFIPGAWLCGLLAFRLRLQVERLALSCLAGLLVIHGCGFLYLSLFGLLGWLDLGSLTLGQAIVRYSVAALPAQGAIVCTTALLAFCMRRVLLY
jgi:biotin transport system substrate-specific component